MKAMWAMKLAMWVMEVMWDMQAMWLLAMLSTLGVSYLSCDINYTLRMVFIISCNLERALIETNLIQRAICCMCTILYALTHLSLIL